MESGISDKVVYGVEGVFCEKNNDSGISSDNKRSFQGGTRVSNTKTVVITMGDKGLGKIVAFKQGESGVRVICKTVS